MRGSKEGVREIQSPLGDGNDCIMFSRYAAFVVREIQSPLGDGNLLLYSQ